MTHNHSREPTIEKVSGTRHLATRNQHQTDSDTPQTVNTRQPTFDNKQQATMPPTGKTDKHATEKSKKNAVIVNFDENFQNSTRY
jgi:hypothetical protein